VFCPAVRDSSEGVTWNSPRGNSVGLHIPLSTQKVVTREGAGMPTPDVPLEKLGFLTIGLFDGDDPAPGHESVLQVIELGEQLGFDSA
jgi:hypothetical protein